MDTIMEKAIAGQILLTGWVTGALDRARGDKGQASTEYAGILFVIVAIIGALVSLQFTDIGDAIKNKIKDAIGKVGTSSS